MKRKQLAIVFMAALLCLGMALGLASNALYFTAAYVGLCACSLVAFLGVEKPWRWLATLSLLFGVTGVYIGLHGHTQSQPLANPNQRNIPGAPVWIQWSSAHGGNDHWYALTASATDWDSAEKLAISYGGTLATITSAEEQNFINDTFLRGELEHRPVWIGLIRISRAASPRFSIGSSSASLTFMDRIRLALWDLGFHVKSGAAHNDEFAWVTGEDLEYSNWKPGEPSDSPPGESWVAINWEYSDIPPRGTKGDWNDTPLNGTTSYGGNTSGPYYGLMELGQSSKRTLTPSRWALITLSSFALAAGVVFTRSKVRSRPLPLR